MISRDFSEWSDARTFLDDPHWIAASDSVAQQDRSVTDPAHILVREQKTNVHYIQAAVAGLERS